MDHDPRPSVTTAIPLLPALRGGAPRVMPGQLAAQRHLRAADPDLAALIGRVGRCRLMVDRAREPYEALIRAIAHQQLHGKAAEAILGRMLALAPEAPFVAPARLLALPETALRGCGLSAAKLVAMRGVAEATLSGLVPSRAAAARLPDTVLIERLTTLRGIGRWTVEMLLMFSLGRQDIMPVDDFGVREGFRRIKRLDAQPKPRAFAAMTEAWSPYRSIAAWYLWQGAAENGFKAPEAL